MLETTPKAPLHGDSRQSDDGERALDIACELERHRWLAAPSGLPPVGARLVNRYAIEWVVHSHATAPTGGPLHRWRSGGAHQAEDLYPVSTSLVLSLDEDYFLIDGGYARWLYRLIPKSAGKTAWTRSTSSLSGAARPF